MSKVIDISKKIRARRIQKKIEEALSKVGENKGKGFIIIDKVN